MPTLAICLLSEVGHIVDMPDAKSLLDLAPKSTLFMHTGVERSSEYQGLPLPPTLGLEDALS